jgi:hypothetical protein
VAEVAVIATAVMAQVEEVLGHPRPHHLLPVPPHPQAIIVAMAVAEGVLAVAEQAEVGKLYFDRTMDNNGNVSVIDYRILKVVAK